MSRGKPITEVIPHTAASGRVIANRSGRVVAGLSAVLNQQLREHQPELVE